MKFDDLRLVKVSILLLHNIDTVLQYRYHKEKISILHGGERLKKSSRDKGKESTGERSGLCHQPSRTALHTYHENFGIQTPRSWCLYYCSLKSGSPCRMFIFCTRMLSSWTEFAVPNMNYLTRLPPRDSTWTFSFAPGAHGWPGGATASATWILPITDHRSPLC